MIIDLYPPLNRDLASSLQTCLQSLSSSIVAGFAAPWFARAPLALAGGMLLFLGCGLLCWMAFLAAQRKLVAA